MRRTDELTDKELITAQMNAVERPPREHELGGDIYYTCFWETCNESVYKWNNYCPNCGQKIDWSGK